MSQDHLEFFHAGLQLRKALLRQSQFIIMRHGVKIRIAEEEIWKLIQNSVFQFCWRETRSGKRWDGCRWHRGFRGALSRRWTGCLRDNRARFSGDHDRGDEASSGCCRLRFRGTSSQEKD